MVSLKELIELRISNDDEANKRAKEEIESFHASSVGYCERQIFLTKIHAKIFDLSIKKAMQVGTIFHWYIQHIPTVKELFEVEVPIKYQIEGTPAFIVGSADLVAKEKPYVVDIKSTKSLMYLAERPMREHIPQILVYMKCCKADEGELLYVEKATFEMVPHIVKFDFSLFEKTCDKVKRVYEALKVWDAEGKFERIPFAKCGCYFCKSETLDPQISKLLVGEDKWAEGI